MDVFYENRVRTSEKGERLKFKRLISVWTLIFGLEVPNKYEPLNFWYIKTNFVIFNLESSIHNHNRDYSGDKK